MKSKLKLNPIWLIHIFWFAVFLFLSWRMPYLWDDFGHMKSNITDQQITSVSEIIPSTNYYYLHWGGVTYPTF